MDLSEFISSVAATYDASAGLRSEGQLVLKSAPEALAEHAPAGIVIKAGGGKGYAAFSPWFGFFDPDETLDPQTGIYVVYLFAGDLKSVSLSLNQGMEHLRTASGDARARQRLAEDASRLRPLIPSTGLDSVIDLRATSDVRKRTRQGTSWLGDTQSLHHRRSQTCKTI